MRSVSGQIDEEWLILFIVFNSPQCLLKKDIGTVPFCLLKNAVVLDDWVEITSLWHSALVSRVGLADAARAMDEDLVKATIFGLIGMKSNFRKKLA